MELKRKGLNKITTWIGYKHIKKLKEISEREGLSLSGLIRVIVQDWLVFVTANSGEKSSSLFRRMKDQKVIDEQLERNGSCVIRYTKK
mgnify:CR=1 FL=1